MPQRLRYRRLLSVLVVLVLGALSASALAGSVAIKGSLASTDPLTSYYQTTEATSCGGEVPSKLVSDPSLSYHYKAYTFRNISKSVQCVEVSLAVSASSGAAARASAHTGSAFDPANPLPDLLGDDGNGAIPGAVSGFSFRVPCFYCDSGPATFVVVVREDSANIRPAYTLLVEGPGIVMVGGTAAVSLRSFRAGASAKGVLVSWRTRSELGARGFNLYRGPTRQARLTRSLIRAAGDARGHSYSYLDRARRGEPDRYWLEVVLRNGSKIEFGPAVVAEP